jgi:hypothetical protein
VFPQNVDKDFYQYEMQCFQPVLNRIAICLANQKRAGPRATGRPPTPAVGSVSRGSALAYCKQASYGARRSQISQRGAVGVGRVCPSAIR